MDNCKSKSLTNKPTAFLVHGFNVRDSGKGTTDCLAQVLRDCGYNVRQFDYGWIGLLGARTFSNNLAQLLASLSDPGDICIGHSNGCNIINQAINHGAKFSKLMYISPALDKGTHLGAQIPSLVVLHTKKDWIVQLSAWLPWHPWGSMGRKGFTGKDNRVKNIDCSEWSSGHSDYFSVKNLARLESIIVGEFDEKGLTESYCYPNDKLCESDG